MANEITPDPQDQTEDVQYVLTTDAVQGDPAGTTGTLSGPINVILQKIVNTLKWLKDELSNVNVTVDNASESERGIIELANQSEAVAATDTIRAMTPRRTRDLIRGSNGEATTTRRGTMEVASQTEGRDGSSDTRMMTPNKTLDAVRNGSNYRASASRYGAARRASSTEVEGGTNTEHFITPADLNSFFFGG